MKTQVIDVRNLFYYEHTVKVNNCIIIVLQPKLMPGGNYIKIGRDSARSTCLLFAPPAEEVGVLAKYLNIFEKHGVNLLHIESRPSAKLPANYEFMVECAPGGNIGEAITEVKHNSEYLKIISRDYKDNIGITMSLLIKHFSKFCSHSRHRSMVPAPYSRFGPLRKPNSLLRLRIGLGPSRFH